MYSIYTDFSLKTLNTFGLDVNALAYCAPDNVDDLAEVVKCELHKYPNFLVLGGGSNLLFENNFAGLIIHPQIKGIDIIDENDSEAYLRVGAGVVWDDLVNFAVQHGLSGIENLSHIPGNVGAAPVQNIGAYGVEAKDSIVSVEGIYIHNRQAFKLSNAECGFAYRNSIFKRDLLNSTIITRVNFRLSKKPVYTTNYGQVNDELKKYGEINLTNIRSAIVSIRQNKLPDPGELGNAGSFFKNPIVDIDVANELKQTYPQMPLYPVNDGLVKLAAGWLIEQCGLKGYRKKQAGVHDKQALVLVNYGGAKAGDIIELARYVQTEVFNKFGVGIEPEVIYVSDVNSRITE